MVLEVAARAIPKSVTFTFPSVEIIIFCGLISRSEQARNGFVDGKSDIYSLGIVMYEMVTGRVPFDGDTTVAVAIPAFTGRNGSYQLRIHRTFQSA